VNELKLKVKSDRKELQKEDSLTNRILVQPIPKTAKWPVAPEAIYLKITTQ
jgi:hypothetical protein